MLPGNDRDSQHLKLLYFATCLRREGSLKKPYFQAECMGMTGSDDIGCTKDGTTASVEFFSLVTLEEHNNLEKENTKNVSSVAGPSP